MHQLETPKMKWRRLESSQISRKYSRAGIPGFVGDIADGKKIIGGVVDNISTGGFEIINLPNSFTAEQHTYSVILSGEGKHYKILAKPCWRKKKRSNTVDIGFKVLDAPWEWLELTIKKIPETHADRKS